MITEQENQEPEISLHATGYYYYKENGPDKA